MHIQLYLLLQYYNVFTRGRTEGIPKGGGGVIHEQNTFAMVQLISQFQEDPKTDLRFLFS